MTEYVVLNARQFGEVIRKERLRQELFQQEVADMVGTDQASISHWELAKSGITFDRAVDVANALGFDVLLVSREDDT